MAVLPQGLSPWVVEKTHWEQETLSEDLVEEPVESSVVMETSASAERTGPFRVSVLFAVIRVGPRCWYMFRAEHLLPGRRRI